MAARSGTKLKPVHLSKARRSWFFPSAEIQKNAKMNQRSRDYTLHRSLVARAHTIYKSLQALHQGFDGAGQVPWVLLDVFVNNATTAKGPVFRWAIFCHHFKNSGCER